MEKLFGKIKRNKKGSLIDIIFIGGVLVVFAIIVLLGFKIAGSFNDQVQGMSDIPDTAKSASSQLTGLYSGTLDNAFLFLTIGLALGTLVLAALVRVHPIFIPFFLIGLVIVVFFCGILSNIYQEIASSPTLAAEAAQLTFITHIVSYLPFIVGIFGIFLMVVMYKLWSADQY